ncbi:glycosyltransferase family 90 protein [Corynascus similis CBS 632.67]
MRNRQVGVIGALFLVIFFLYTFSRASPDSLRGSGKKGSTFEGTAKPPANSEVVTFTSKKFAHTKPKPAPGGAHPIWHLINDAEREFKTVKDRQSRTLHDAVAEYRRRYGLPPPPHFDKWWSFAKSRNVQLVDEFDTIHELLTPFWGLKPSTIRARAREALGADNQLMGVQIRGGKTTHVVGGFEWMQETLPDMMKNFVEYLPDMDLVFNVNDEPRVVVPHDDMTRLVHTARTTAMPAANTAKSLRNGFSPKPADLSHDGRFDEVKYTRFDFFAHQPVWSHSRMSCPPDSPSRILEEEDRFDDIEKYAIGDLGFVANWTAMSDICLSPSLGSTYGFFERPNAYGVVHDLFPIFSQSKISSYNDIIYPSPWYWAGKVPYSDRKDPAWNKKHDRLYWRGSTTGGFSRDGGWRRQHRQRFVQKINAPDKALILAPPSAPRPPPPPSPPSTSTKHSARAQEQQQQQQQHQQQQEQDHKQQPQKQQQQQTPHQPEQWATREVPRGDYKSLIDVYFSHVGQCDPGDCDAQRAFFEVKDYAKQEDALKYRHVLDLDGNAFSGRFYALLHSRSLVYKWAIFREWHYEWLRPWVHFVPLSLHGDDWLEVVRFFASSADGKGNKEKGAGGKDAEEVPEIRKEGDEEAERMALRGREWAQKALRNEDLEVWFFRLLLEYGRVVDDNREKIGYVL